MEQLKELYFSTSIGNSKSNSFKILTWKFYDENNHLRNLDYKYSICRISALNKTSMLREEVEQANECFTISFQGATHNEFIKDINHWLKDNFKYIKKSYDNCMKSLELLKFITSELGEYNYATTYEYGWSIKDFYKLYIDLYSTKIILNYKGKETQLTEQKLKTFIQKNKKLILQTKENEHKKYIQRQNEYMEKERIEKITAETERLNISKIEYDATRKVNYGRKNNDAHYSFALKRSLKERYEAQACKPFPEKYPWHNKSK